MVQSITVKNKIILITGGYGYLGKAITESLIYHGAKVYVLGRNEKVYNIEFKIFLKKTKALNFQYCDISDLNSIENAIATIFKKTKRIDVFINNAYYMRGKNPEQISEDDWDYGIDGTLSSVQRCMKTIIPYFKKNGKGKIINVASMYGVVSPDFSIYKNNKSFLSPPDYGSSKAAIIQLTKYYASYYGLENILINSVSPGPFPSKKVQKEIGFIDELKERTMLNKIGTPEDLAGIFVFLSSEASNYITGQNIIIDGGWTSK